MVVHEHHTVDVHHIVMKKVLKEVPPIVNFDHHDVDHDHDHDHDLCHGHDHDHDHVELYHDLYLDLDPDLSHV